MFSVAFMVKRTFWAVCLCLTLILFPLPSYALTVQDVPNPRREYGGWVTDMAEILSPDTEAKLNQIIFQLERQNGDELAVVTVPETTPAPNPKAFTTELFNYWGIGKQGKNNGVLFLVSKSDRHVEIRTGYGIESVLPNAQVSDIIQKEIIPQFKQGNFEDGILAGTKSLVTELGGNLAVHTNTTELGGNLAVHTNTNAKALGEFVIAFVLVWGLLLTSFFYNRRKLMLAQRPVFIHPEGRTRVSQQELKHPVKCANCSNPLKQLNSALVFAHLTKPERVANKFGSVQFLGWQCPNCQPQLTGSGIHIRAYTSGAGKFRECPTCRELTMVRTTVETLIEPTIEREGKRRISFCCYCCSYLQESDQPISRLYPSKRNYANQDSSSSSDCGCGSSWDSWDGGGGSDFGSGDSGGGAGGDW